MKWYKSRLMYVFGIIGFIGGMIFLVAGLWFEFSRQNLNFTYWSFIYLHTIEPMFFMIDLAPLLFSFMAGLIGLQRDYFVIIARGKREWEATFDSFVDLIFVTDESGVIIRCNHSVIDRLNTYYANVLGKQISEVLSPDNQGDFESHKDGSKGFLWLKRLYAVSTLPIEMGEGKRHILFTLRDITRQEEAETALEKSDILFQALFNLSPDAVIVIDPHDSNVSWPIIDCNITACMMNGYQREELIGQSVDILNLTIGSDAERTAYLEELRQAGNFTIETSHRRKNGEVFPVEVSTSLIMIGERELIIGIDRDITERKQVEAELIREKQFLEALISNSPAAIIVLDNNERIISCNPAFEELYGYTESEALNVKIDSLIATPKTLVKAQEYTQKALSGIVRAIGKRRRKDGSSVDVQILGVPIIVGDEKVGALAIYNDITELVRARKEAEQASRAKSDFLANMSHEIRTPMNGVMGMLELALDTQLTSEQRDYLQTSLQSAETLLVLLNDILDFSKIESGMLEIEAIDFNLRTAVEDVAFTLASRAQTKGLEMACLIHPNISNHLKGDPNRLRQILVNLTGNAIKFTHQGEIVIRAEPIQETDHDVTIHFSVSDTGIGIPPDRQAQIFERFSQADTSTTRKYGGTGLGLTISRQLVGAMGGKIGLESTAGTGSTFWFDIKFEKQPRRMPQTAPLVLKPVRMKVSRILIVDDNQTNRTILVKIVEGFGCRVDTASTGSKAIELLRHAHQAQDPYRVVLLDMQMPGMDGEQTARAIKSDPAIKNVKILILTSMGQRGDAVRLQALGCSGYLLKPVKQKILYDALLAVLGQKVEEGQGLVTRHVLSEQRRFDQQLLLAEDNPINQKLAIVLLQKAGFSVDAVDNGLMAIERVKAEKYSVVLMDVQMPEMDGYEATRKIRLWEQDNGQHIPIVAMTAHAMQGDRELCIKAGMDDYITKPLEPRVLYNVLEKWIPTDGPNTKRPDFKEVQDYSTGTDLFSSNLEDGLFGETQPIASTPTIEPAHTLQIDSMLDIPPINFERILNRFGDDRAFMMEMFGKYMEQLPVRVDELKNAVQQNDASTLGRVAHNVKGVSQNFNAIPISAIALRLEQVGASEDLADAPKYIAELESEIHRLQEFASTVAAN